MSIDKCVRRASVFRRGTGRTVIVAQDRGSSTGPMQGIEKPVEVVRLTGGFTVLGGRFEEEIISTPEAAIAFGAATAEVTVKLGHEREGELTRRLPWSLILTSV